MRSSLKDLDISEGVDKEVKREEARFEGKKLRRQRMQKEGGGGG